MVQTLGTSLAIDFDFFLYLTTLKRKVVFVVWLRELLVKSSRKAVVNKKKSPERFKKPLHEFFFVSFFTQRDFYFLSQKIQKLEKKLVVIDKALFIHF